MGSPMDLPQEEFICQFPRKFLMSGILLTHSSSHSILEYHAKTSKHLLSC